MNQQAVLIYTSGTTANPKGVILFQVGVIKNQDAVTWTARLVHESYDWEFDKSAEEKVKNANSYSKSHQGM